MNVGCFQHVKNYALAKTVDEHLVLQEKFRPHGKNDPQQKNTNL